MRMLVTVEFADAETQSGTHRVLIIGRGPEGQEAGDIGLTLSICAVRPNRLSVPPSAVESARQNSISSICWRCECARVAVARYCASALNSAEELLPRLAIR